MSEFLMEFIKSTEIGETGEIGETKKTSETKKEEYIIIQPLDKKAFYRKIDSKSKST